METIIHETALSAMNMAINRVWNTGTTLDSFTFRANSCTSRVNIFPVGTDTTQIRVRTWASIYDPDLQEFRTREESMSAFFANTFNSITDYFMFTNNSGGLFWVTGCTIWGPYHDNSIMHTLGRPVFYGKVTARRGITPDPSSRRNRAEYHDGWEIGIDMTIPTDMSHLVTAATAGNGTAPLNTGCIYNTVTTFEFLANGNVIRQVGANPPDTVALATIAPTGVLYSTADVRVKGTLNGEVTVYSTQDIWIDDDVVYADNPMTNFNSDDVLGLVSGGDTWITDNAANNDGININACIVTVGGSYKAENWNTRPIAVERFMGSIAQAASGAHGVANHTGTIVRGFYERMRYDPRLAAGTIFPPNFVGIQKLELASWWE
jgi:hypothetical protein